MRAFLIGSEIVDRTQWNKADIPFTIIDVRFRGQSGHQSPWHGPHRHRALGAAMRRRAFVEGIAALGVAWPLTVRAQQPAMPVVGFLSIGSPESDAVRLTGLRRGLNESGLLAQSGHRTPSGTL